MKAIFGILAVAMISFCAQTAFFPQIFSMLSRTAGLSFLEGHVLDVALLVLTYLALHRSVTTSILWAVAFGFFAKWFGLAWIGAQAVSYVIAVIVIGIARRQFILQGLGGMMAFGAAATLFEGVIHLHAGRILSFIPDPFQNQLGFLIVQTILGGFASPFVFSFMEWLDGVTGAVDRRERSGLSIEL